MSRMQAAETTGGRKIYEMVYYNQAYVDVHKSLLWI